jgi:hypothetical protein
MPEAHDESKTEDSVAGPAGPGRSAHDEARTDDSPSGPTPPDPRAAESLRQQQAAIEWLEQKWTTPKTCPICMSNSWQTSPVQQLLQFTGGGLVIGGPVVPVFLVVCNVCGYTLAFNAILSGVVKPEPPQTPRAGEPL